MTQWKCASSCLCEQLNIVILFPRIHAKGYKWSIWHVSFQQNQLNCVTKVEVSKTWEQIPQIMAQNTSMTGRQQFCSGWKVSLKYKCFRVIFTGVKLSGSSTHYWLSQVWFENTEGVDFSFFIVLAIAKWSSWSRSIRKVLISFFFFLVLAFCPNDCQFMCVKMRLPP